MTDALAKRRRKVQRLRTRLKNAANDASHELKQLSGSLERLATGIVKCGAAIDAYIERQKSLPVDQRDDSITAAQRIRRVVDTEFLSRESNR